MKYKNVITGAIIDSPCLISGEDWEEVFENITNENEETVEGAESTEGTDEGAESTEGTEIAEDTEEQKKGKEKSNKK